jgi:hypothetical protein
MTLQEVLLSGKKFKRSIWDESEWIEYFRPGTGPNKDLVGCDYFVLGNGEHIFSTSLDLYAADILAEDWEIKE